MSGGLADSASLPSPPKAQGPSTLESDAWQGLFSLQALRSNHSSQPQEILWNKGPMPEDGSSCPS